MSKYIASKIRKIRKSKSLSQERFGKKIGLSGKTISAYETGKIVPPYKVLEKISTIYQIEITIDRENVINIADKISTLEQSIKNIELLIRREFY